MSTLVPNRTTGMPRQCKSCGAWGDFAKDNLGMCDVCYWRTRHDALKDAVTWMREVTQFDPWPALKHVLEHGRLDWQDVQDDFLEMRRFARAEVDRLVDEE